MSETVERQDTNPEVEEQKVDVSELIARLERLEGSNKRLLDESKQWKSKYQNVKNEVEERERTVLEQNNDFKGLYEKTLGEVETLKGQLMDVKKSGLETSLKYEVAKHGSDAEDVDILLAAVKTKKKDLLGFDAEVGQWKGVDAAIDELRKSNSGLFKSSLPGTVNGRPQPAVEKERTVDDLINEDPAAVLKEALSQIL